MTDLSHLESVVEAAWDNRAEVSPATGGEVRDAVETALNLLDSGQARVASRGADGAWTTHQWLKKAAQRGSKSNRSIMRRKADGAGLGVRSPSSMAKTPSKQSAIPIRSRTRWA